MILRQCFNYVILIYEDSFLSLNNFIYCVCMTQYLNIVFYPNIWNTIRISKLTLKCERWQLQNYKKKKCVEVFG